MSAQTSLIKSIIEALISAGIELAKEYGPQLWETISNYWAKGKTLAVIGPTACGKDSLIARLQGKPVPDIHINTGMPEDVAAYKVEYPIEGGKKISFTANKSRNVGGEEPDRDEHWADVCQNADVIFYMLDAQKVHAASTPTLSRLKNDMRWLAAELGNKNKFKLIIVLNKFDLLLGEEGLENFEKVMMEVGAPMINEIKNAAQKTLGVKKSHLGKVLPLCTTDGYLFGQLFPPLLLAAAEK